MAEAALPIALQAGGSILGGIAGSQVAGAQALQLRQKADEVVASSQRSAFIAKHQADLLQSRQVAAAGASGAGVSDPTVQNIRADTARAGEYNALSALYQGKSQAQDMVYQAKLGQYAANQNMTASILGGGATIFDKYKGDLPPWMTGGNIIPDSSWLTG